MISVENYSPDFGSDMSIRVWRWAASLFSLLFASHLKQTRSNKQTNWNTQYFISFCWSWCFLMFYCPATCTNYLNACKKINFNLFFYIVHVTPLFSLFDHEISEITVLPLIHNEYITVKVVLNSCGDTTKLLR